MDFTPQKHTVQEKKNFVFEEKAHALAAQLKFYEAASVLEEIETSDEIQELGIKLLMAECYMQLGRENKATRAMKDVRKIILKPPKPLVDAVMELADGYDGNASYVRELFLFQLANEMYQESDISNSDKFDGVYRCLNESRNVASRMLKSTKTKGKSAEGLEELLSKLGSLSDSGDLKKAAKALKQSKSGGAEGEVRLHAIAMDFGVENMLEMFEYLRKADGVPMERKAIKLAKASNAIGYVYVLARENEKAVRIRQVGVEAMEKVFGSNASRHRIQGDLLHNLGVSFYNLDRCKEAETHYKRAIAVYEVATDYDGEHARQKSIDKSKSDLKDTRQRLVA